MKKFLLPLFLAISLMTHAQKSFVQINVKMDVFSLDESGIYGYDMYLTGDIPTGIDTYYHEQHDMTPGILMGLLSQQGYELEKAFALSDVKEVIIMSKNSTPTPAKIETVQMGDVETHEVARYNLQGIPVKKTEKGVQIIVFSNYTTKTVVVE